MEQELKSLWMEFVRPARAREFHKRITHVADTLEFLEWCAEHATIGANRYQVQLYIANYVPEYLKFKPGIGEYT